MTVSSIPPRLLFGAREREAVDEFSHHKGLSEVLVCIDQVHDSRQSKEAKQSCLSPKDVPLSWRSFGEQFYCDRRARDCVCGRLQGAETTPFKQADHLAAIGERSGPRNSVRERLRVHVDCVRRRREFACWIH